MLTTIEMEPKNAAQKSIIWLHGLGADGNDFVSIVPELHLPETLAVRFIFPHAPIMPITINNGYKMRAWYDITSLAINAKIDSEGMMKSVQALQTLIEKEISRGIESKNMMLAGFSQGAVIALLTGLLYKKPLAGILALSGYLPLTDEMIPLKNTRENAPPIFMAHGTEDTVVPYIAGQTTYQVLKKGLYPIEWHSYAMPHSVCAAEIKDISQWIQVQFNSTSL